MDYTPPKLKNATPEILTQVKRLEHWTTANKVRGLSEDAPIKKILSALASDAHQAVQEAEEMAHLCGNVEQFAIDAKDELPV